MSESATMELGGEVFTMGLALKLQKMQPHPTDFGTEFRRENSNTGASAAYTSDGWDGGVQVSSSGGKGGSFIILGLLIRK